MDNGTNDSIKYDSNKENICVQLPVQDKDENKYMRVFTNNNNNNENKLLLR